MELFTPIKRQRFKQMVERVLHVPGNYRGGILEMALVVDCRFSPGELKEALAELVRTLKQQSETFRNVRLNLVLWKPGEKIQSRVVPMSMLAMGDLADEMEGAEGELYADDLLSYLKLFQARAKLILVLSAGKVQVQDEQACRKACKPFLERKMIWLSVEKGNLEENLFNISLL
ncbi:MAG: hypothetical protein KH452_09095 [Clostridiales bacterium]|nr:hypothetical protein [Clostridiales bacterium]